MRRDYKVEANLIESNALLTTLKRVVRSYKALTHFNYLSPCCKIVFALGVFFYCLFTERRLRRSTQNPLLYSCATIETFLSYIIDAAAAAETSSGLIPAQVKLHTTLDPKLPIMLPTSQPVKSHRPWCETS